jgi:PAS domain S-box-containing protein
MFDNKKNLSFSVGRYEINDLTIPVRVMYDRANLAKQSIKGKYKTHVAVFDEKMLEDLKWEQWISSEMSLALDTHQFEVWFQPQVNHSTKALIGAEALVRWNSVERGLISPARFIPIFEQNGFIYELDKFVWEKACQAMAEWKSKNIPFVPISVNISRLDFFQPDFITTLNYLVSKYHLQNEQLRLEITESAFSKNSEQIIPIVTELVNQGFILEIDDFGSGYSSLNILKDVPASIIKLDMKFFEAKGNRQRSGNIVESIVRMTKWLGMSVIAEGVELLSQADFLKSIGCVYIQGYYYAKPMRQKEYEQFVTSFSMKKELNQLYTINHFNNDSLWLPESLDSIIFNSFIGGACLIEYFHRQFEVLRMNDKFIETIGSREKYREDLMRIIWIDYLDEDNRLIIEKNVQEAISSQNEKTFEVCFHDLPGCEKNVWLRSFIRIIASSGNRYLVYCTFENITKQKQSEQNEAKLGVQLRSIMNNINAGIAICFFKDEAKDSLEIEYANKQFYDFRGYTKEEFNAEVKRYSGCIIPEDYPHVKRTFLMNNRIGNNFSLMYRVICKDQSIHWMMNNISISTFPYRKDPIVISVTSDVTSQKEQEEKIKISEAQFRIAATMGDRMIARYDFLTDTFFSESKSVFDKLIGNTLHNVPSVFFEAGIIAEESIQDVIEMFKEMHRGLPHLQKNIRIITKENVYRWLHCEVTTFLDDDDKPKEAILVFHDISDEREKETVYQKWQQSLQEKNKNSYTLFCCNISKNLSFDLRTGSLITIEFPEGNYSYDARTRQYVSQCVKEEDQMAVISTLSSNNLLANYYRGKKTDSFVFREKVDKDNYRWLKAQIELVEYPDSKDVELYLMFENIDSQMKQELITKTLAEQDSLTHVLNRYAFITELYKRLAEPIQNQFSGFMMIDLDGFKSINDTYGHLCW